MKTDDIEQQLEDVNQYVNENLDIYITQSNNNFTMTEEPQRIDRGIFSICIEGEADIEIDFRVHHIEHGTTITLFPIQTLQLHNATHDLKIMYFAITEELLHSIIYQIPSTIITFLCEHPVFLETQGWKIQKIVAMFLQLKELYEKTDNICKDLIIKNLIQNHYLFVYSDINQDVLNENSQNNSHTTRNKRKNRFIELFLTQLKTHYKEHHEVSYYAQQLCITPKYLSMLTSQTMGRNAKAVIDQFLVTEIKLQLRQSTQDIQKIAADLNFPDQAFLSKYFKKHTGQNPSQWRKK